ncbi:neurogenic locus notch homolog protein 1 [Scleropages formosus]|uniref:neurogenic locus notch homolog protein 1 n=1 Tax=Scleropages formosus TaxID=113540 RepID=UPI0010FAC7B6|nr:neurogenic locus notch homolog protein 1-like [Scleropages formosus]
MDTRLLGVRVTLLLWGWIRPYQVTALSDPWAQCPSKVCKEKFADGSCEKWCATPECLMDGFDCLAEKRPCEYIDYCRDHYANSHCEQGCNRAPCGWDGSDCFLSQAPTWAKGTLLIHTKILSQDVPAQNRSLLWALSTILQTTVTLRGVAPFDLSLFALQPNDLRDLLTQKSTYRANGSLLFLQVDNRPCSSAASTCFPSATQAGNFLRTAKEKSKLPPSSLQELQNVYEVRGVEEELGDRENYQISHSWLWPVVGVTVGLFLALVLLVAVAIRRMRRRTQERAGGGRVQHVSTVTETNHTGQPWTLHTPHRGERMKKKEKEKNGKKKKKKAKDSGKRRSEPLGEDAIRLRPLRKEVDIGSDTDITQSSMEDINSIRDHRPQEQKHFRVAASQLQSPSQVPSRRWERNSTPPHNRPPNNSAPVQWCGPDGSVVLIRAVRSGLDRVVLELLRAGVPVNNTDHTGRSALHWACSVNNLSLARTLVRYGALVDLQDYKGETALFLSAIYGCYDTARFLLLHGANSHLPDRRGRRPLDVAREGFHQQVLELLLAHRPQRAPTLMNPGNDVQWSDPAFPYDQWLPAPGLPGRSASFSGVIGYRETSPPHPSEWSVGRGRCVSPQHWRPQPNQSATALVSPRILARPSRPISTLQEVTSEAEEEERERPVESGRAATPHLMSPQPAPRQRSFSCTQHALQRRSTLNQVESSVASAPAKAASEQVDRITSVPAGRASSHSETKPADLPAKAQSDSETRSGWNCVQKAEIEGANYNAANSEPSTQTVL